MQVRGEPRLVGRPFTANGALFRSCARSRRCTGADLEGAPTTTWRCQGSPEKPGGGRLWVATRGGGAASSSSAIPLRAVFAIHVRGCRPRLFLDQASRFDHKVGHSAELRLRKSSERRRPTLLTKRPHQENVDLGHEVLELELIKRVVCPDLRLRAAEEARQPIPDVKGQLSIRRRKRPGVRSIAASRSCGQPPPHSPASATCPSSGRGQTERPLPER